jgi:hypothetical protein
MPLAVVTVGVLWGLVTVGPLTPACHVGTACGGPARKATLTFSQAGRVVSAKTDAAGRYRVTLATGLWTVRASVGMRITPLAVRVRAGTHRLDLAVDTGIR